MEFAIGKIHVVKTKQETLMEFAKTINQPVETVNSSIWMDFVSGQHALQDKSEIKTVVFCNNVACPSGQVRDLNTGLCGWSACPSGQVRDLNTGICNDVACGSNSVRPFEG